VKCHGVCSRNPTLEGAWALVSPRHPLDQTLRRPSGRRFRFRMLVVPTPGRAEAGPEFGALHRRAWQLAGRCARALSGGVLVGSTMSFQVPRRRLGCFGLASANARCLAGKLRIRSRLYPAIVKPSSSVIFV
jgi:hypothetical protein